MFSKKAIFVLSSLITLNAFAINNSLQFHRKSLLMKSNPLEARSLYLRADGTMRSQEEAFFDQKLDHKNSKSVTFKQRYFVDSQYAENSKSPVFYIICGEWNCAGTGSYSFVESLAKDFKAHLVALEHRFYGESLPFTKLNTDALKYLNLQSAIDDLAHFQRSMMKDRGLQGKWVAFGGSYAGTLAAFYREKHPELVTGSLASSAPVFMKNEFKEYDAHVAKVINKSDCGNRVREAVKLIENKISTNEGALEVKKIFKASNVINNSDFLYVVADMLAAAVQYGKDKSFCSDLMSESDLVTGYAKAGLGVLSAMGTTPFDISLAVAEKVDVTPEDNMRQWMWQSCREFGWFQVANGKGLDSSRSSKVDLAYHNEICKRLYSKEAVKDGALNKKWYLPLFNPETSKIIFSNGSNDPWLTLSLTEYSHESNREFDLFMMEGAAHCNDLRLSTNLSSVSAAHYSMKDIISNWLK
jgi:hypothetical protein